MYLAFRTVVLHAEEFERCTIKPFCVLDVYRKLQSFRSSRLFFCLGSIYEINIFCGTISVYRRANGMLIERRTKRLKVVQIRGEGVRGNSKANIT